MSQFAGLFKALKNEEEKPTVESSALIKKRQAQIEPLLPKEAGPTKGKPKTSINKSPAQDRNHKLVTATEQPNNTPAKNAGNKAQPIVEESIRRRRGKSSNPEYTQVLSYIRKNTYKEVKRVLLDEPEQDFSELIENLLSEWLINRT